MSELTREQVEWKQVVGYEGLYEVSQFGKIRSLKLHSRRSPYGALKPFIRGRYPSVSLWKEAKDRIFMVHRLVLEAFVGPCPSGMQGAHANGDRSDARLSNLNWKTQSQNEADKIMHGTQLIGQKHHQSKLTNQQAIDIYNSILPTKLLSEQYHVHKRTIEKIRSGRQWGRITQCPVKTASD